VITSSTEATVFVVGLNGIGEPLDEAHVFRPLLWSERTGQAEGEPVTAEAVAAILALEMARISGQARAEKTVVFLNQTENPERERAALRVAEVLERAAPPGLDRVLAGSLRPAPRITANFPLANTGGMAAGSAQ
jgi:probable selenium-dependent hydroxylase accessory protein YqeC